MLFLKLAFQVYGAQERSEAHAHLVIQERSRQKGLGTGQPPWAGPTWGALVLALWHWQARRSRPLSPNSASPDSGRRLALAAGARPAQACWQAGRPSS